MNDGYPRAVGVSLSDRMGQKDIGVIEVRRNDDFAGETKSLDTVHLITSRTFTSRFDEPPGRGTLPLERRVRALTMANDRAECHLREYQGQ